MYGVVFCDARGVGYKAARDCSAPDNRVSIEEEAEWLRVASTVPAIRQHIARFRHYYARACVIERECILGTSGRHADKRQDIHAEIRDAMHLHGFGMPEYKNDSYRWQPGRGWVLVDASSPIRRGNRLVARAVQTLKGARFHGERPADVAWELRMEAGKTVDDGRAQRLSDRLESLPDAQRFPR